MRRLSGICVGVLASVHLLVLLAPSTASARGELLPNLPSYAEPVSPDISNIELTPDGTDLSDCAAPAKPPPALDLSGIALAPAGADVLEEQYRKRPTPPPPATEHLQLEE